MQKEAAKLKTEKEKQKAFVEYYRSDRFKSEIALPNKSSFHHFRFEFFSENKLFRRIKEVIENEKKLVTVVQRNCPKNVFFTPVKWLDPVNLRRKKDKDVKDYMLSSPLFFDIDMQLISPPTLTSALETTERLIDCIEEKTTRKPDWIVFSGSRGFHVYYWEWDDIVRQYCSADMRIAAFIRERKRLLAFLNKKGVIVDFSVTADPWRLLRVPGTLHGESGFIAKVFKSLDGFSIDKVKF